MAITKSKSKEQIERLVNIFDNHINEYKGKDYKEATVRIDFINPFLSALGWDVDNKLNLPESYREVIHEDKIKIDDSSRAPDYCITINGNKKFYIEAKKPSISLKDSISSAYQLRRYGWNAKMPISIITDFEEFSVYDCQVKPQINDKATIARINYITYKDYLKEFDFFWDTFSKESVKNGSLEKYFQSTKGKRASSSVDEEFLKSLDSWRDLLAKNLVLKNPSINEDQLNYSLQKIIDRIIFLRISEDRGVENQNQLLQAIGKNTYSNLRKLFHIADQKYNSGLFDYNKDIITDNLNIDNGILQQIIEEMYYPKSPYEFSVIPVEILGHSYEQYLGKTISINSKHKIIIEEKPEVRKAGGVYYTPQYIVDYIVQNTVGKLVEGKKPEDVAKLKICDPACGSGSFLLGAYQFLLNWHREYYNNAKIKNKEKYLTPDGNLTTSIKKEILLNNIYGVDIDSNAVEVTKLSLMIKAMEGETKATINHQLSAFHDRVLPSLDKNIKSGNSLIDMDFYESQIDFEPAAEKKIKPFSWEQAFPEVFKQGGFDAVIGNPPYGVNFNDVLKKYYLETYLTVEGRYDNFELFIEKGINLLNKNSQLGFIIPSPFLTNLYSRKLREYILENCNLMEIVNFSIPVFSDPTVHTCIMILNSTKDINNLILIKNQIDSINALVTEIGFEVSQTDISNNINSVIDVFIDNSTKILLNKLERISRNLGEICFIRQCIKTGNDDIYVKSSNIKLEEPWKQTLRGKSIGRYVTFDNNTYLKYGDWLARNWKNTSFYETPKIAIRETGKRITSTLDLDNCYLLSSLYSIYYKDSNLNNENELKFLLGLLNSNLSNYFIKLIALNLTEGAFTKIRTNQLARLPIIEIKSNKQIEFKNVIIKLVETMLQLNKDLQTATLPEQKEQIQQRINYTDKKIDQLVYQLYDLTEEEIKVVEGE